jgi:rod shape determining protein RodA
MQLIWIATAFALAFCVLLINSRFYSVFSYFIYFAIILLLILVLFLGKEVNGSRSWFVIGSMRLQPAELAKLATSLALAKAMSSYGFRLKTLEGWTMTLGLIMLPVTLILLQKDWGSAVVFFIFILMFYREGLTGWALVAAFFTIALFIISLLLEPVVVFLILFTLSLLLFAFINRCFLHAFIAAVIFTILFLAYSYLSVLLTLSHSQEFIVSVSILGVLIILVLLYAARTKIRNIYFILLFFISSLMISYSVDYIYDNLLKPHHRNRIEDMLGIKVDIKGAGYNVHQAKVAIGSGGFTGKGYLQGTQTKFNFVPEQSTDFIFCTVGEERGFVGSFFLIALYVILLIRIIMIAERQKHSFARIYGYCVASIFFFHFFINIAMTIGLAPVIGIPLPFISYGGSSLWSFTMLLFILVKLDAVRLGER